MLRADTDNVVLKKIGAHYILLDYRSGRYFQLNETAVCIWKCLSKTQGADKGEIVRSLTHRYAVQKARATSDVSALLRTWKKAGLLVDCL